MVNTSPCITLLHPAVNTCNSAFLTPNASSPRWSSPNIVLSIPFAPAYGTPDNVDGMEYMYTFFLKNCDADFFTRSATIVYSTHLTQNINRTCGEGVNSGAAASQCCNVWTRCPPRLYFPRCDSLPAHAKQTLPSNSSILCVTRDETHFQ